jgi:hypothetical protein
MDRYLQDSDTVADRLEKSKHQARLSEGSTREEIRMAIAKLDKSMKKSTDHKILAEARAKQAGMSFWAKFHR